MNSLRAINYKAFADSGDVLIRPVTVFVGRNSSGKSSLLRLLPMLRQSAEVATRGPLLWFGPYVDLGEFSTVRRSVDDRSMEFHVSVPVEGIRTWYRYPEDPGRRSRESSRPAEVSVRLEVAADKRGRTQLASLVIGMFDHEFVLTRVDAAAARVAVRINGVLLEGEARLASIPHPLSLLPRFELSRDRLPEATRYVSMGEAVPGSVSELANKLRRLAHGRSSQASVTSSLFRLRFGSQQAILSSLMAASSSSTWRKRVGALDEASPFFLEIQRLFLATMLPEILRAADEALTQTVLGVSYIRPLRATAERAYRFQDIAVEDIDPDGSNVAMYLQSLSPLQLERLNRFISSAVDIEVSVRSQTGHIAVFGQQPGGPPTNVADMGFGFSQVLPFLIQLWQVATRRRNSAFRFTRYGRQAPQILVVEQPELHLHPALQATIGAAIVGAVTGEEAGGRVKVVLETHSEYILNEIGRRVVDGAIDPSDVVVHLFEGGSSGATVRTATFSADGRLRNWPLGFFAAQAISKLSRT
jgi:hypothetical protein